MNLQHPRLPLYGNSIWGDNEVKMSGMNHWENVAISRSLWLPLTLEVPLYIKGIFFCKCLLLSAVWNETLETFLGTTGPPLPWIGSEEALGWQWGLFGTHNWEYRHICFGECIRLLSSVPWTFKMLTIKFQKRSKALPKHLGIMTKPKWSTWSSNHCFLSYKLYPQRSNHRNEEHFNWGWRARSQRPKVVALKLELASLTPRGCN